MNRDETIAAALDIIRATEDGDKLHPHDLHLVEAAVNGFLTEEGKAAFEKLHSDVSAGRYVSPFDTPYWGIENLRIDPEGYVYWRSVRVEHYDAPWRWSDAARAEAEKLAAVCRRWEAEGREVTSRIVWLDDAWA